VTIISSGLVAGGFVASYAAEGVVPFSGFVEAGFHFWIGDAIGIVVVVPPLLLLYERITQWTPPDYDRPHFDSLLEKPNSCAAHRADRGVRAGHVVCGQVRSGLSPGGRWIRWRRQQQDAIGRHSKGGNKYLRKLLIHGARAVISAHRLSASRQALV
jgi:hypothetical protein